MAGLYLYSFKRPGVEDQEPFYVYDINLREAEKIWQKHFKTEAVPVLIERLPW